MEPHGSPLTIPTERNGQQESDAAFPCLDIEIDERVGLVRVHDPRLFRAGRRSFCKRLVEAVSERPEIRRAEINLAAATCQMEFGPGLPTSQALASAFVSAVRQAAAGGPRGERTHWWQNLWGWSTLTAFRLPEGVSLWETFEVKPGRIRLRHQQFQGDRTQLSRLADSLAGLDGVEGCCVYPLAHRITIDYRPESPHAYRLLDRVEQTWEGLKAAALWRAESSTLAHSRLRRTAWVGPILRDWEDRGGLSRSSKRKLTGLTLTITVVTIVLAPLAPASLALIVFVSSLSIYGISRIPPVPEELQIGARPGWQARLALPSP